jgi:5-methylthioadenosine/S-adenosylhomocysteine deaminase
MKEKQSILIENAWILTLDSENTVIEDGYLFMEDGRITEVGEPDENLGDLRKKASQIIDAEGMILMPGLVNGHSHLFQTFTRGFADDKLLYPWLKEEIWPFSAAMEHDDFALAGLLGCVENLKNGATAVIDQHYVHTFQDSSDLILKAMKDTGIRGTLCRTFSNYNYTPLLQEEDETIFSSLVRLTESYHNSENGRLQMSVGPINPWGCTVELYQKTYEYAMQQGLKYQIHTAETENVVDKCLEMYGKRNVEFFDSMGILGENTQLAHAIWLDDAELELTKKAGASVVHCPVANMFLADGIARVPEMRDMGISVCLGTDGPGSNNSQDMMEVLKTAVLLHKVNTMDPMVLSAEDVLQMACVEGAKALGREDLGRLQPGYVADMILVDWKKPHIAPVHKPASAVVFCANGNDVDTSIVDGKVVMRGRKVAHVDEIALIEECQLRARAIKRSIS